MASSSMANLLSVGRKRSGSFSEVRSIARSLSSERPATPRPTELEPKDHCVDSGSSGFKKPEPRFFGSMDSIHSMSSSKINSSLSSEVLRRSFSTHSSLHAPLSAVTPEVQAPRRLATLTDLSVEGMAKMDSYSSFTPTSVTLSHFLDHGSGGGTVEDSYMFLRKEIPVRIANILKELELLPEELLSQPACMEIIREYGQSFQEILQFEHSKNTAENHTKFNVMITDITSRHKDVVPRMAEAVQGMKSTGNLVVNGKDQMNKAIQYILDRLYMARISIRMLIAQHQSLYCPFESTKTKHARRPIQGIIDPSCDPADVLMEAYEEAAMICDQIYMDHPKINIKSTNTVDKDTVSFVYVPGHLHHMFFEVLKNSMRATMEFHAEAETVPDIEVHIVKSSQDITIKISDYGGGISRSVAENAFLYAYTSASAVTGDEANSVTPMHGLGYGLPLSKLYSKYFGGDIKIASCDGHGTDAYIYLKALETDARETLPVFNASSAARIKDTKQKAEDWTKDE